jgi:5'-nucleotidase/UDP-sugar diphosphatase
MNAMKLHPLALCTALALAGCASSPTGMFKPLELNIAHINDHHSNLEVLKDYPVKIDGVATTVDMGGFARVAAVIKEQEATKKNLLKIHAGDGQAGTMFNTIFEGEADAAVMNKVCFDSFTLGNHEFDAADAGLTKFLDFLKSDATCRIPVLSANIRPAVGTPLKPSANAEYFKPYIVKQIDGVAVGIVGITVRQKTVMSSRPLASTEFQDEIAAARTAIDALKTQGVRHIIVASHFGYENERRLATQLPEVDVVIGGDSHTLLGDDLRKFGLPVLGSYPTMAKNAEGDTVCIGQAWEYSKAIGLMQVRFNAAGKVDTCSGEVIVPIGNNFKRDKKPVDAAVQAALTQQFAASRNLRIVSPDAEVAKVIAGFRGKLDSRMGNKIGTSRDGLCHVRVPGGAATPACGPQGSDAAQVVAQAFLQASRRPDVSLQNAGGVRVPVPAGDLTYDTAYRVLPFSNTLVELDMTGAEIVAALEDGVSNWLDPQANGFKGSDGSHPYAAGLRWTLNLDQPKGQRFTDVEVKDRTSGKWGPIDPKKTYVLITNDFIASGRDGYKTLGTVFSDRTRASVDTSLYYTQTFVDYLMQNPQLTKLPATEYSHQKVIDTKGKVMTSR